MNGNHRKGFASMDKTKLKEVTSRGGKTTHKLGKAHKYSHEEAVINGYNSSAKRLGKKERVIFIAKAISVDL